MSNKIKLVGSGEMIQFEESDFESEWEMVHTTPVNWEDVEAFLKASANKDVFRFSYSATPVVLQPPTPSDLPTNAEIAEVLEAAADLFESEKLAWVQNVEIIDHGDGKGVVAACAIGALSRVKLLGSDLNLRWLNQALYSAALSAVTRHLGGRGLPHWNDEQGRTVDEVIDLFKTVAKDLRNQDGQ